MLNPERDYRKYTWIRIDVKFVGRFPNPNSCKTFNIKKKSVPNADGEFLHLKKWSIRGIDLNKLNFVCVEKISAISLQHHITIVCMYDLCICIASSV